MRHQVHEEAVGARPQGGKADVSSLRAASFFALRVAGSNLWAAWLWASDSSPDLRLCSQKTLSRQGRPPGRAPKNKVWDPEHRVWADAPKELCDVTADSAATVTGARAMLAGSTALAVAAAPHAVAAPARPPHPPPAPMEEPPR